MPTVEEMAMLERIEGEAARAGMTLELINKRPPTATWYRKDGTAVPRPLPTDPYSIKVYTRKGLSLVPPANPVSIERVFVGAMGRDPDDKDKEGKTIQVLTAERDQQVAEGAQLPHHRHNFAGRSAGAHCKVSGCIAIRKTSAHRRARIQ